MNAKQKLAAALVCLLAIVGAVTGTSAYFRGAAAPHRVLAATVASESGTGPVAKHAPTHAGGGSDAISAVTTSTNGLALATDELLIADTSEGPNKVVDYSDDFTFGGSSTGAATLASVAGTAVTSNGMWRFATTGTGAIIALVQTGLSSLHPGAVSLKPGTTTTGVACMARSAASTPNFDLGAGQLLRQQWWLRTETLSDGTNTFSWHAGWATANATLADGCVARYGSAAPMSGQIICSACTSSSCTNGTGGTPPTVVATTWYLVEVDWDASTNTCSCLVDGTNIGSIVGSPTTAHLAQNLTVISTAGTGASREVTVDYYREKDRWTPAGRR